MEEKNGETPRVKRITIKVAKDQEKYGTVEKRA